MLKRSFCRAGKMLGSVKDESSMDINQDPYMVGVVHALAAAAPGKTGAVFLYWVGKFLVHICWACVDRRPCSPP